MASKEFKARVCLRRDSGANWAAADPVLLRGEAAVSGEDGRVELKIGDGVRPYSQLPFAAPGPRSARLIVGAASAGWTAADCDCLCDGTDDQEALNAAIAALPAGGGEIVLLDGVYSLTAPVELSRDNVFFTGNGPGTAMACSKRKTSWSIFALSMTGAEGCELSRCRIEGHSPRGVVMSRCTGCRITGNRFQDNGAMDLILSTCDNNFISGNESVQSAGAGCFCSMSSSNGNIITCNRSYDNKEGVRMSKCTGTVLSGNHISRGAGTAADYAASEYTVFLSGTGNSANLVCGNVLLGKDAVSGGGAGNLIVQNLVE